MEPGGIFSAEQLAENDRRKQQLFKLIASGEAFLMVGAGSSKLLGYPLWGELLIRYEEQINRLGLSFDPRLAGESDLVYASRIKKCLGRDRYYTVINDTFADRGFHPSHVALVSLPFKCILTTNYDPSLGLAVRQNFPSEHRVELMLDNSFSRREIYKFLRSLSFPYAQPSKVVHLHGEYGHPDSIILCSEEYEQAYGIKMGDDLTGPKNFTDVQWTFHRKLIWSLMATRRLVYIGFSMNDPYFKIMHQLVSDDIANFDSDAHFLVARITAADNIKDKLEYAGRLRATLAIETVFFFDDSTGTGLSNFILEIEKAVTKLRPVAAKEVSTPLSSGSKEVTDKLFEKSRKQLRDED